MSYRQRLESLDSRERFRGYLRALFSQEHLSDVRSGIAEHEPPENHRVRLKLLYSTNQVLAVFADLVDRGVLTRLSGSGAGFRYTARLAADANEPVFFAILPTSQTHASALVTVARREPWLALLAELRRHYPDVVPILLSQRELITGVSTLQAKALPQYDLRVREITAKEKLDSPEGDRVKSVREWTYEEWQNALASVTERRRLLVSVGLDFHRRITDHIDVTPAATCRIAKSGEVDLTGNFDLIWRIVVEHIARVGQEKLSFYAKRGLRERNYEAAPLSISFSSSLFDRTEEVRRLVDVLRQYPRSMHSVQHGNPYAYVQIADAFDGSSFDVLAVAPSSLSIVPKLKATEAAIARLIHYLLEAFQDGVVTEYAK